MTPLQKLEGPSQPVYSSSQASTEAAEASIEDIPTSISPITPISRTRSVSPLQTQWTSGKVPTKPSGICWPPKHPLMPAGGELSGNWMWYSARMSPKQLKLSKKPKLLPPKWLSMPRPPVPSWSYMPRLLTQWWSGKLRQPEVALSKKPKLPVSRPLVRPRPKGSLRLSCSNRNTAPSCRAWRNTLF